MEFLESKTTVSVCIGPDSQSPDLSAPNLPGSSPFGCPFYGKWRSYVKRKKHKIFICFSFFNL